MKRYALLLLPLLILCSVVQVPYELLFVQWGNYLRKGTTSLQPAGQNKKQAPASVLLLVTVAAGPTNRHLYEDGLVQSPFLKRATTTLEANLVWIFDSTAEARPKRKGKDWCMELLQQVKQTQEKRARAGLSNAWPIHFVDNKDGSEFLRCELVEEQIGKENTYYHQRGIVVERVFDPQTQWVTVGKLMTPPRHVQFFHKPIGVRSDIVQVIQDELAEQGGSITDTIESLHRGIDVSYFWDVDINQSDKHDFNKRFRNRVYQVLEEMMEKYEDRYHFALGERGDRQRAGRMGVSTSYIQGLLESKIVVLAQRDQHEDHYRLMEALVAGPLVLTDKMLSLPQGLKDGTSIVEYTNADDMKNKIEYYLQHDKERTRIAGHGKQVAMSRYRSWHQLEEIVFGHPMTACSGVECMEVNVSNVSPLPDKWQETHGEGSSTKSSVLASQQHNQIYLGAPPKTQKGQKQLLVFGGRGTTATEATFKATCQLGIPSMHWRRQCISLHGGFGKVSENATRDASSLSMAVGAHSKLIEVFMSVPQCLIGDKLCPDMLKWRAQLMELTDTVVQSDIGAIHHTPYPSIMTYLLKSLEKHKVQPTIFLMERDPKDWTKSRSGPDKKSHGLDLLCKKKFTGDGGPFDVFSCMDRAMDREEPGKNSSLHFSDVFVTLRDLANRGDLEYIEFAMKEYQDWLRLQANFTIDVSQRLNDPVMFESLMVDITDNVLLEDFRLAPSSHLHIGPIAKSKSKIRF